MAPVVRLHGLGPTSPYAAPLSDDEEQAAPVYLHPNGNLLSARLIPPTTGHGPAQAKLRGADPRLQQPGFEPCPIGGLPNPAWTYHPGVSGVDAKPTLSWWNFLTFGWVSPLIATGFKRDIDAHDLWLLPEPYMAHSYTPELFRHWHAPDLRSCTKNRLAWTIWRTFRGKLFQMWGLKWLIIGLTLLRPVLLALLRGVTAGADRSASLRRIAALSLTSIMQALLAHHFWWIGVSVAMSDRGSAISLVEFDSPKHLLSNSGGCVSWRVEETNKAGKNQQQHRTEQMA